MGIIIHGGVIQAVCLPFESGGEVTSVPFDAYGDLLLFLSFLATYSNAQGLLLALLSGHYWQI